MSRLDRKLKVLRDEQIAVAEETAVNEALGMSVANRAKAVAKPQEANKFKTHVQEVGHITSLLLSLSGRLARVENALLGLAADHPEKVSIVIKKKKNVVSLLLFIINVTVVHIILRILFYNASENNEFVSWLINSNFKVPSD